jgi:hypothetical protein
MTAWVHSEAFHRGEPFVVAPPEQLAPLAARVEMYARADRGGHLPDAFTIFRGWNARLAIAREADWLSTAARHRGDFADAVRYLRQAISLIRLDLPELRQPAIGTSHVGSKIVGGSLP